MAAQRRRVNPPRNPPLTPIEITVPFRRKLNAKPREMQTAIWAAVRQLRVDPRHPGLRVKKITSAVFEARIDEGNRLTFFWDGPRIVLENHCHHDIVRAYGRGR